MDVFLQWVHQSRWRVKDYMEVLIENICTRDCYICIPFQTHMDTSMLNFTWNGSWRIKMGEWVPFLLWEGVDSLDACKFRSGKFCKTCLRLNFLLLYDFNLLVRSSFLQRHGFGDFAGSFGSGLHSKVKRTSII